MRDTIDMAREAGIIDPRDAYSEEHVQAVLEDLKAFEALVRADEREACANAAEDFLTSGRSPLGRSVAAAIRARGETK
jgi:hypothetical protein